MEPYYISSCDASKKISFKIQFKNKSIKKKISIKNFYKNKCLRHQNFFFLEIFGPLLCPTYFYHTKTYIFIGKYIDSVIRSEK